MPNSSIWVFGIAFVSNNKSQDLYCWVETSAIAPIHQMDQEGIFY